MSLALDDLDRLAWADLTADEKRDAVTAQLVEGRNVSEATELLSVIYGPIGENHVNGIITRFGLTGLPAVVAAREARAEKEKAARASRARARTKKALPAPKLPGVPAPAIGTGAAGVTIFDLTATTCRAPLWGDDEPGVAQKFYCGKPVAAGKSYCPACLENLTVPLRGSSAAASGVAPGFLLQPWRRWS